MARTPDRRPGESYEEGTVYENRPSGDVPSQLGGIRFVDNRFQMLDGIGVFDPREGVGGPPGPEGPAGPTGPQGPVGSTGPAGPTGADGATGATGSQGPKGDSGAQGTAGNTVRTTSGVPSNAVGVAGDFAYDPTSSIMYGPKTTVWPAGVSIKGAQGVAGNTVRTTSGLPAAGVGVTGDFAYDPTSCIIYGPKSGGAWTGPGTLLKGPQGATGATGADGAAGPKGDTGAQGPAGADGAIGATGIQGPKGDTGDQGPKGDTGDQGPIGLTGATGSQGPKGDTGDIGPQGPKGDTGSSGTQGPKGDTGATGSQGPIGNTGAQGPTGSTGAAGADGRTVLTTSGAPSSGIGANGDFAYDPSSKTMYGPKTAGAWGAGTSLVGSQGPQGATGSTGSTGATGPTVELTGFVVKRISVSGVQVGAGAIFSSAGNLVQMPSAASLSLASTGLGGRGSPAAEAANTWYYVHMWHRSGGPGFSLDVSATAPTPVAGFVAGESTLIGAVRNDASSNLLPFFVEAAGGYRRVIWDVNYASLVALNQGIATSFTNVDLSAFIPNQLARTAILTLRVSGANASDWIQVRVSGQASSPGHILFGGDETAGSNAEAALQLLMPLYDAKNGLIQYAVTNSSCAGWIYVVGYEYFLY